MYRYICLGKQLACRAQAKKASINIYIYRKKAEAEKSAAVDVEECGWGGGVCARMYI